jgi:hypothetical protein
MTAEQIKAAERKYWRFIYLISAPFLLLMIYNTEISRWVSALLADAGIAVRAPTVALVQIGAGLVLFFGAIFGGHRWFLAHCSKCSKAFYPNNSGIVIATKNCPNCGAQVIPDAGKP